jgi:predicted ATP-binding protein involved in virulence|tara:strand:+ start:384 stop:770 length:387 start_codon:yes stop_codon:yes gene_type:complete
MKVELISQMPAGKLEFKLSLDKSSSSFASFIEWYENTHRTINEETGRKRKGNAKKAIQDFLDAYFGSVDDSIIVEKMNKEITSFKEDTKLSPELQKAKINLSADEFETLQKLLAKSEVEEAKLSAGKL